MNMQNVKDLSITEGDVRTIHDSNGNLLWGRLAYDTKYAGDTFQQTYTGKNMFNINTVPTWLGNDTTYSVNGNTLHVEGKWFIGIRMDVEQNTDYYVSATRKNLSSASASGNIGVYELNQSTSIVGLGKGNGTFNSGNRTGVFIVFYCDSGTDGNYADFENIQIEKGTSQTSYEPYVGGTASPNPDYPQDIQVVTGTQTVTVSDGVNSHDYTVNLGSLELAKIGTHQDYIYKSGDNWYVHKAIKKMVLDGRENWTHQTGSGGFNGRVDLWVGDSVLGSASNNPIISDHYVSKWALENNVILLSGGAYQLSIIDQAHAPSTQSTDLTEWKSWLSTHNTTVYYALATSTNTQITDSTLIGQLNAIHEWLTRYGYNSTVSGNLPLLIEQTNLS